MLKNITNIAIFSTFILVVGFLGIVLWESLFNSKKTESKPDKPPITQAESQGADKEPAGTGTSPHQPSPTEEALVSYTKWLAVFTALLVLATIALFVSGERNVEVARESAKAAIKSAEVSERALIVTQRAIVRVVNFPWVWRPDWDPARIGKYWYHITPIVENFGNAATIDAKINVNYELRDTPLPEDFEFPFKNVASPTILGPKQNVGASAAVILDEDLLQIRDGKKFFYIWGTITYGDGFENTPVRTTEFCAFINRVFGDPLDPREPGNPKGTTVEISFGIYPKHYKIN